MDASDVTAVLADNLKLLMRNAGVTQVNLAKASGVAQTTISLYLNPSHRSPTATGKVPSPVLAQVARLARALHVELWELLCPLTPAERGLIKSIHAMARETATSTPRETSGKRTGTDG